MELTVKNALDSGDYRVGNRLKGSETVDHMIDTTFVVPGRFAGKTVIVVGGAMGIGGGTAQHLGAEGANVFIADWNEEWGKKTAAKIKAAGGKAIYKYTDINNEADVKAMVDACVAEFGSLDACANIAGLGGEIADTANYPSVAFSRLMENNVNGIFLSMKYEIAKLLELGKGGNIVNAASVGAFVGVRYNTAYITSKHAIMGLTRTAAAEYAERGIRVNAIGPHVAWTPMVELGLQRFPELKELTINTIPMRRVSTIDEVARITLFLLSDECPFLTGQGIVIDGGWTAASGG